MNATELTKEIYDKYERVFDRLEAYIKTVSDMRLRMLRMSDYKAIHYRMSGGDSDLPFRYLYGLLEDFFEENGIVMDILYYKDNCYGYVIYEKPGIELDRDKRSMLKNEAKYQAILKACEILEDQLNV